MEKYLMMKEGPENKVFEKYKFTMCKGRASS
jgi:hypothetical protein